MAIRNPSRPLGILLLALGAVLLLYFFSRPINPSVTAADLGLMSLLFGSLTLVYGHFSKKIGSSEVRSLGWLALFAGLGIALGAFLLESQTACSCPANVPCRCVGQFYGLLVDTGVAAAGLGALWQAGVYLNPQGSQAASNGHN